MAKSEIDFNKKLSLVRRTDTDWDRVVFAEVLIPETPNVFGDYWTKEAIIEAAYEFMRVGFGVDVEHDNVDRSQNDGLYVVESFIARASDPIFIPGSWVIGMKVADDTLWQQVLDGELNGFSYEAIVAFLSAILKMEDDGVRTGVTDPDVVDGHTHTFMVIVDENGRPAAGGTDETDGHSHTITTHTVTDITDGHVHRYTLVSGKDGK